MARIGTTYARQHRRPDDAIREQEEAERKEALQPTGAEPEELAGVAAFREEFDSRTQGMGGEVFTADPVNAAIEAAKAQATERVEARNLTSEQRLAKAIAAELAGEVAAPPDLEDEPEDDEPVAVPDAEFYRDEAGAVWQNDGGRWQRVDAEAQDEAYDALGEWSDSVDARSAEDAEESEDEESEDWAGVWDGSP